MMLDGSAAAASRAVRETPTAEPARGASPPGRERRSEQARGVYDFSGRPARDGTRIGTRALEGPFGCDEPVLPIGAGSPDGERCAAGRGSVQRVASSGILER